MRTVTIALSILVAASADAAIRVTVNGEPAVGAEVCGFRAPSAETPFKQLLSSNEIVCGAMPPALWNVFARRGTSQISARTVLIDARHPLPDVELRLEAAASVAFPKGANGVVYVTDTVSAFPAGADGVALVPAERDLLPLLPRDGAPVAIGTGIAVLIRHLGFWSLNGCRVVYNVGRPDDGTWFGFAYGTLTNHAEAGEELFELFVEPTTQNVVYRIRATSWPQATLARIGQPIVRALQARFRRHSAAAMQRATRAGTRR